MTMDVEIPSATSNTSSQANRTMETSTALAATSAASRQHGDEHCDQACTWRQLSAGNTWHCCAHVGAVHVCDMRCRFREVVTDHLGNFGYRCPISGAWTYKRLIIPVSKENKRPNHWGGECVAEDGSLEPMSTAGQDDSFATISRRRFVRARRS